MSFPSQPCPLCPPPNEQLFDTIEIPFNQTSVYRIPLCVFEHPFHSLDSFQQHPFWYYLLLRFDVSTQDLIHFTGVLGSRQEEFVRRKVKRAPLSCEELLRQSFSEQCENYFMFLFGFRNHRQVLNVEELFLEILNVPAQPHVAWIRGNMKSHHFMTFREELLPSEPPNAIIPRSSYDFLFVPSICRYRF